MKRKTKDVVCKKCNRAARIPVNVPLSSACCVKRNDKGRRCRGSFQLKK